MKSREKEVAIPIEVTQLANNLFVDDLQDESNVSFNHFSKSHNKHFCQDFSYSYY